MAAEAEPAAETGGALSQQDAAELEAPEADGNEAQADGDEGPGRGAGGYETRLAEAAERIAEARQRYNAAEKDGLEAAADVGHELMGVCRRQWYRVAGYETFEADALA